MAKPNPLRFIAAADKPMATETTSPFALPNWFERQNGKRYFARTDPAKQVTKGTRIQLFPNWLDLPDFIGVFPDRPIAGKLAAASPY